MFIEIFPENCRGHFLRVQNPTINLTALPWEKISTISTALLAFSTNINSAELSMSAYSLSSQNVMYYKLISCLPINIFDQQYKEQIIDAGCKISLSDRHLWGQRVKEIQGLIHTIEWRAARL